MEGACVLNVDICPLADAGSMGAIPLHPSRAAKPQTFKETTTLHHSEVCFISMLS